jgi:hypothetical protein
MNIIRLGGFLAACALLTAPADARDLKTISGDVFKNITLSKKDATGIQITHDDGVAFIDFKNLSAAEQKEFGYDPATYATGWVQKIAADKQRQQQQALAAQQAAARAKAQAAQAPVQEAWKPTNQTGLEVTIDSPGFRYGPYQYYGRGFSNTIPPSQGGQLVPYPYNANGPYPYYNGATWGPTIIRQR